MKSKLYNEGFCANRCGLAFLSNPYLDNSDDWDMWRNGWLDAMDKDRVDHYIAGDAVSVVDEAIKRSQKAIDLSKARYP